MKLRILVVEDKASHRKAAEETLSGHELTIVNSFDEAIEIMKEKVDQDNVQRLLVEAGFPERPADKALRDAYYKLRDEATAKSTIPFPFDVVLTDMMMPMSRKTIVPEVFNPEEQVPYGLIIALNAASRGAKYVAMVTDTNHHQGAMSAAIDHLGSAYYHDGTPSFSVNGAKVLFVHAPFIKEVVHDGVCRRCTKEPGVCRVCNGTGHSTYGYGRCYSCKYGDAGVCKYCHGSGNIDGPQDVEERKDWGRVLASLVS